MIDLQYSRQRMLEDLGAPVDPTPVGDLADPRGQAAFVASDTARLVSRLRDPEEALPILFAALLARFAVVDPKELQRNLLMPLKKALGNAHKRGNRLDPAKSIALEVLVTRSGAFFQVTDEGEGFDVESTCKRFTEGTRWYTHGGSGFRKFTKARAVVSFDDGGRTVRLRFRVADSHARLAEA